MKTGCLVRDCACRCIQGYYYGAPLPQEQVYKLLGYRRRCQVTSFFWRTPVQVLLKMRSMKEERRCVYAKI